MEMNLVSTCSYSSVCSEYSVPCWVYLSVGFSEIVFSMCSSAVSRSVYIERFWIKCAEMVPLLSRGCQCTVEYTVPYGKMKLVPTKLTLRVNGVRFR